MELHKLEEYIALRDKYVELKNTLKLLEEYKQNTEIVTKIILENKVPDAPLMQKFCPSLTLKVDLLDIHDFIKQQLNKKLYEVAGQLTDIGFKL